MQLNQNPLLVICGPTATGKTALGLYLAKLLNGEIISSDSRQVYKGLDVGTGKDIPRSSKLIVQNKRLHIKENTLHIGYRLKNNIPIWLVDIVSPDYVFNVGEYAKFAQIIIDDMYSRKKLPIIVGGTGLYIQSILDPLMHISIPPDTDLRRKLALYDTDKMREYLNSLDETKWKKMNQSDRRNPRRLARAIEIALWRKKTSHDRFTSQTRQFYSLLIGLTASLPLLKQLISIRIKNRVEHGFIREVRQQISNGNKWNLPALSATGYKQSKLFIEGHISMGEMTRQWQTAEYRYAKRQLTWFKRDKRIQWFDIGKPDIYQKIEDIVRKWYTASTI